MGYVAMSKEARIQHRRALRRAEREKQMAADKGMRTMAERIVKRVIGKINNDIIRPGPKPEERECTEMAQELRDLEPELIDTVFAALKKPGGKK